MTFKTAAGAVALAFFVAPAAGAQAVHPGEQQGLGLRGPEVPQILKDARYNPYVLPPELDCPSLAREMAALDQVLGPDLDVSPVNKANAPDAMGVVREVLPYGGVVRLFTRAGHQEHALVNASLAGWERRGFLKGLARSQSCPGFTPLPAAPAPPPTPLPPAEPAPGR